MILYCKDCGTRHFLRDPKSIELIFKRQGTRCHGCYSENTIDVRCSDCGAIYEKYAKEKEEFCKCGKIILDE